MRKSKFSKQFIWILLLYSMLATSPIIAQEKSTNGNLFIPLAEKTYRKAQGFKGTTYDTTLFHLGKDYCVDAGKNKNKDGTLTLYGTKVYPIGTGKIVDIRHKNKPDDVWGGVGGYVTIDHGGGIIAVYMHLIKITVSKDKPEVTRDTVIGECGDVILHPPPNCPHLHLEIRKNGNANLNVNPNLRYAYVSRDGKTKIEADKPIGDEKAVLKWIADSSSKCNS